MRLKLLCVCLLFICIVGAFCTSCGSADVFTTRYTENDRIDSRPAIYSVEPQFVQSEMLPKVRYLTTHPLPDTAAVEAEAYAMAPAIRELFPGITEGAGYLVCTAFAEPPTDPSKTYTCYTTVVEVKDDE